jgi:glycosyltransferase involved in cell wall biosynthesis
VCFKSRIVVAAESWFGSTTFGLAQGFRRLGWELAEVNEAISLLQGRALPARLLGRLTQPINVSLYNRQILNTVNQLDAKFFLTVKGINIQSETLKKLASRGVKTINYYPDFRFSYTGVDQATFRHYSTFITTKSFQVQTLKEMLGEGKVRFLHHGYSSDVHYPPEKELLDETQVPDVLYIGTYTSHKEILFAQVKRACPEIRFVIYGNGWNPDKCDEVLKTSIVNRPIFGANFAQLANASKINLAIHMGVADDTGWQDLVSTRSFELPACGGFMLHIDNSEIRQLFEVGEEIDVFSSVDDLCEKIRFYLKNESLRKKMAHKAYKRCVPTYSYDQRAREIAAFIENLD